MISNALEGRELPVYGDGRNVRDWIHVSDHCEGLEAAFLRGEPGGTYNLGADAERSNLQVVQAICDLVDAMASPLPSGASRRSLIRFVADRPGHDLRYAIDASLARSELAWAPRRRFEEGLADTVSWYLENRDWVAACCGGGAFVDHYARHYRPGKGGSA
jgi:dTDP-glucose 4,6-dehydratase